MFRCLGLLLLISSSAFASDLAALEVWLQPRLYKNLTELPQITDSRQKRMFCDGLFDLIGFSKPIALSKQFRGEQDQRAMAHYRKAVQIWNDRLGWVALDWVDQDPEVDIELGDGQLSGLTESQRLGKTNTRSGMIWFGQDPAVNRSASIMQRLSYRGEPLSDQILLLLALHELGHVLGISDPNQRSVTKEDCIQPVYYGALTQVSTPSNAEIGVLHQVKEFITDHCH